MQSKFSKKNQMAILGVVCPVIVACLAMFILFFVLKNEKVVKASNSKSGSNVVCNQETPNNDENKKIASVALTFDDGPSNSLTPEILKILDKYHVNATFFVVGNKLEKNLDAAKLILKTGNELANHSYSHKKLTKLSPKQIEQEEIEKTNDIAKEKLGIELKLVRPPYGAVNDKVKQFVKYPLIAWNKDTYDWKKNRTTKQMLNQIKDVHDGDIILMHDIHKQTISAIEQIVVSILQKGFKIVTVSNLFKMKNKPLENGSVYYAAKN